MEKRHIHYYSRSGNLFSLKLKIMKSYLKTEYIPKQINETKSSEYIFEVTIKSFNNYKQYFVL